MKNTLSFISRVAVMAHLLALCLVTAVHAADKETGKWVPVEPGLDYMLIKLPPHQIEQTGAPALPKPRPPSRLKALRFDPAMFDLRVMCGSQYGGKTVTADYFLRLTGAVAVINGGYFDVNFEPLGLLICEGRKVNSRLVTHGLYSGVLTVSESGKIDIGPRAEFDPADIRHALQAGPLLLKNGRPAGYDKNMDAVHHRTAICLDSKHRILAFVSDSGRQGTSWRALQLALAEPEIGCTDLLNLDGGGSAQMALRAGDFNELVAGETAVPAAIGFFRKK